MDENLTKAFSDLTGLLSKLAGPLFEEVGLVVGNKAREYRVRNAIKIMQRVDRMLRDAQINPHAIPARLFLPAFDAASIEDNETLQERWAALIANAADATGRISVSLSFVEVLKQLSPEQAVFLDRVLHRVTRDGKLKPHLTNTGTKLGDFKVLLQLFGGDRSPQDIFTDDRFRAQVVTLSDDLARLGILNRAVFDEQALRQFGSNPLNIRGLGEITKLFSTETGYYLTAFGFAFIQACTAPGQKNDSSAV